MRVSAFVLLGCLGGATAAHAEPGDTLYTQENAVDVRHYPSADAPVVMQLDRGRKLVEIKRKGPWAEVANENDKHLRHVTPGRDFEARFVDLRQVEDGDLDIESGAPVRLRKCIEIGHIFKLGYKYSESMQLRVLDSNGKETTPIMGSYGIGLERILTAAIEQNHNDGGMALPAAIAPFEVVVTPVNLKNEDQAKAAEQIYDDCGKAGMDVLFDDRAERAGVKFKDADLIGIPYRIVIGRGVGEGNVELVDRSTGKSTDVRLESVVSLVAERLGLSAA